MLDNRIMRVTIIIGSTSRIYEQLAITAKGTKFTTSTQGECMVTIANLSKEVRDQILTNTSPFANNRVRSTIVLDAGRESYGYSTVYAGDIYRSSVSQAPDNIISLRCLTAQFNKGLIINRVQDEVAPLSRIAQGIAEDNGLNLQFLEQDKNISNYQHSGAAINQVEKLEELSGGDVYIDGSTLVVKPSSMALPGAVRRIAADAGMVGIPEFTEQGLKVTFLFDPDTKVGSEIEIDSIQYPAANGRYIIYKLQFDLANRDTPFYYIAEARRA